MTESEAAATAIMLKFEAGAITAEEARRQLIGIGVSPSHADEMIFIAQGGDDVIES